MDVKDSISVTLKTIDGKETKDQSAKNIFSYKPIMSNILKYTVEEYRDCSLEEIMNCIEGDTIQTGTALVEEDMAKTIRGEDTEFHTTDEAPAAFDILFRSLNPKAEGKLLVNLHIDFEIQQNYTPGYPVVKRSIYYGCRKLSAQLDKIGENGKGYDDLNLVIVHMGGGVSVAAHKDGLVIDVNNTLDGDGPFSPERAGSVPVGDLIKLCFSGKYTQAEVYNKIVGKGGYVAYLNTNDARDVLKAREEGDEYASLIFDAFIYQVSKAIGEMATVLNGRVDQIILTGGIAYSPVVVNEIKKRVEWISDITVYPGEDELLALAQGAIRVLDGEEEAKIY